MKKILITGGAGFIGSHVVQYLGDSAEITVLDNLSTQVHGNDPDFTSYTYRCIKEKVRFIKGDVLNPRSWAEAIKGQDVIIHLAAETGTGQSMYELKKYTDVNIGGTALMLEAVAHQEPNVKKIILSSSRAVYGEGKYYCKIHGIVYPKTRKIEDLQRGQFECKCPICNASITTQATDEDSLAQPVSIYGITKYVQEQYVATQCKSMNIPYTVLRYQNVYGPGQSLSNPYTGILSIFSNLILNRGRINIFEDGHESRDFVFVDDVARITSEIALSDKGNFDCLNIGTGVQKSVSEIVGLLQKSYDISVETIISGDFRVGDIRHNYADVSKLKAVNLLPVTKFDEGITAFGKWVRGENTTSINYLKSLIELTEKGLLISKR